MTVTSEWQGHLLVASQRHHVPSAISGPLPRKLPGAVYWPKLFLSILLHGKKIHLRPDELSQALQAPEGSRIIAGCSITINMP